MRGRERSERDLHRPLEQLLGAHRRVDPVQYQEREHAIGGGALVAVHERMIADDRKTILSGRLANIVRAGTGLLRLAQGGLEQALIAKAEATAEGIDLIEVNGERCP